MVRQILAIVLILIGTSVGWIILGTTIFARTYDVGSDLTSRVESTWGAPEEQTTPVVGYQKQESKTVETEENGKKTRRQEVTSTVIPVPIEGSRIDANFHIDYRQKGLLWFSTYVVNFSGRYDFHNPNATDETFVLQLPFPRKPPFTTTLNFYWMTSRCRWSLGDRRPRLRLGCPQGPMAYCEWLTDRGG